MGLFQSDLPALIIMLKVNLSKFTPCAKSTLLALVFVPVILAGSSWGQTTPLSSPQPRQAASSAGRSARTALDDYIALADPNYAYHLVNTFPGSGQTTFVLEMTSQAWL